MLAGFSVSACAETVVAVTAYVQKIATATAYVPKTVTVVPAVVANAAKIKFANVAMLANAEPTVVALLTRSAVMLVSATQNKTTNGRFIICPKQPDSAQTQFVNL